MPIKPNPRYTLGKNELKGIKAHLPELIQIAQSRISPSHVSDSDAYSSSSSSGKSSAAASSASNSDTGFLNFFLRAISALPNINYHAGHQLNINSHNKTSTNSNNTTNSHNASVNQVYAERDKTKKSKEKSTQKENNNNKQDAVEGEVPLNSNPNKNPLLAIGAMVVVFISGLFASGLADKKGLTKNLSVTITKPFTDFWRKPGQYLSREGLGLVVAYLAKKAAAARAVYWLSHFIHPRLAAVIGGSSGALFGFITWYAFSDYALKAKRWWASNYFTTKATPHIPEYVPNTGSEKTAAEQDMKEIYSNIVYRIPALLNEIGPQAYKHRPAQQQMAKDLADIIDGLEDLAIEENEQTEETTQRGIVALYSQYKAYLGLQNNPENTRNLPPYSEELAAGEARVYPYLTPFAS